jgi:glycerophosphoryl diester phosphodiesterase
MTLLIAHRGNTISFPENTLTAFLSAFEKGAGGIELDIHLHNGEIIVVHNFLFDRNMAYPKLEDILEKIHSKGRIEIEIKEFATKILPPLKEVLNKFPQADFELATSEIPLSPYIKNSFPRIPLGLIFHDFFFQDWMTQEIVQKKLIGWGKMTKADRLHVSFETLSKFGKGTLVEELHKAGFIVHSHIFDTDMQSQEFSDLSQWKVDQCTFDSIELLKNT